MISSIMGTLMTAVYVCVGIGLIISYVLNALGYMKCMEKAGEQTWKAWIPVYNEYVMYKVVGLNRGLISIKILYILVSTLYLVMTFSFTGKIFNDVDKSVNYSISTYSNGSNRNINTTRYSNSTRNSNSVRYNNYTKQSSNEYDEDIDLSDYIQKGTGLMVVGIFETVFAIGLLVVEIFFAIYIAKSYGLGGGTIAGMILVPTIFILIIGFGSSEYKGPYKKSANVQ